MIAFKARQNNTVPGAAKPWLYYARQRLAVLLAAFGL